jgi:hypothetical protein
MLETTNRFTISPLIFVVRIARVASAAYNWQSQDLICGGKRISHDIVQCPRMV